MKICPNCGEKKPFDGFYPDRSKRQGVSSYCRSCQRQRSTVRYRKDPAGAKEYRQTYYRANRERFLTYGRQLRERVLREYGGACACCGERTPEFLAIDHVANDGESHRREIGGYGRSIYRWLEQHGYPKDGFQLLCHNCNMAKGLYGGCPHQGPPPGRRQRTTRWTRSRTPAIGGTA